MNNRGFVTESVVLCDDIRQENTGKAILIGVYSGDIVISSIPARLGISLWLQGRATESAHDLSVRALLYGAAPEGSAKPAVTPGVAINVEPGNEFTVALTGIPTEITEPGYLAIQLKYGDRDWTELIRKRITLSSGDSSSSEQPPQ